MWREVKPKTSEEFREKIELFIEKYKYAKNKMAENDKTRMNWIDWEKQSKQMKLVFLICRSNACITHFTRSGWRKTGSFYL